MLLASVKTQNLLGHAIQQWSPVSPPQISGTPPNILFIANNLESILKHIAAYQYLGKEEVIHAHIQISL